MARILGDKIPRVLKPQNPQLLDIPISELQDSLANNISWLTHVFGRSYRLLKKHERKEVKYAVVPHYGGRKDYISVMPDQELGNFCFFVIQDPEDIGYIERQPVSASADFSIIFWADMRSILPNNEMNPEEIKAEVLDVLSTKTYLKAGSITLGAVYSDTKNVYKDFDTAEIESQYRMLPFAAFRVEGTIEYTQTCPQ